MKRFEVNWEKFERNSCWRNTGIFVYLGYSRHFSIQFECRKTSVIAKERHRSELTQIIARTPIVYTSYRQDDVIIVWYKVQRFTWTNTLYRSHHLTNSNDSALDGEWRHCHKVSQWRLIWHVKPRAISREETVQQVDSKLLLQVNYLHDCNILYHSWLLLNKLNAHERAIVKIVTRCDLWYPGKDQPRKNDK